MLKHIGYSLALIIVWASLIGANIIDQAELNKFIDSMVQRHEFDGSELHSLFQQVKLTPEVIEAVSKPAERRPWYRYRPIFLTEERIGGGVEFWSANAKTLDSTATTYGVAPQVVVAIIGVETRYGASTGRYRVMDSLTTLAFNYPERSAFFQDELENYLLLVREQSIDPLSLRGSYAGAMGMPQFIASSYRRYAVDYDGDGVSDIWSNPTDAIASVANYLKAHGWQADRAIAIPAEVRGDQYKGLIELGIKPQIALARINDYGIQLEENVPDDAFGSLVALETAEGQEYWVGLTNFYVITRYNHSPLYAMAIYQLSEAIKSRYEAEHKD
ncbi:MAG: lytic murein transglycosylase B [Gammaproteobacteria bacterium]|nr:lytic murein transglycosylase B [Gammaproteobacteria bacterium]